MNKHLVCLAAVLLTSSLPVVVSANTSSFGTGHCDGSNITIINNTNTSFFISEYATDNNSNLVGPPNLNIANHGNQVNFQASTGDNSLTDASGHITLKSYDGASTIKLIYNFHAAYLGFGDCHATVDIDRGWLTPIGVTAMTGDGEPANIFFTLVNNSSPN